MSGRRSGRLPALSSSLTLLDQVAPAHRAVTGAMAGLAIGSPHHQALERFSDALAENAGGRVETENPQSPARPAPGRDDGE